MLYLWSFIFAFLITITIAFSSGAFHQEAHPDPTTGDLRGLLAIILGTYCLFSIAGLFVVSRWIFWPTARTTAWNIQAAAYSIIAMLILSSILYSYVWPTIAYKLDKSIWAEVENTPLPEGVQEAYFPASSLRFEARISEAERFREFAIEGNTAYQREGWLGYGYGQVSKRSFINEQEAKQVLQTKIKDSEREGYQQVFNKNND
jgi:predicted DNA-binding WGR domain protein